MSDEETEPHETNQASIYMRTSAANGFDGNEVEVHVRGGEGEEVDDIEDIAQRRFKQAVNNTECDESDIREYQ